MLCHGNAVLAAGQRVLAVNVSNCDVEWESEALADGQDSFTAVDGVMAALARHPPAAVCDSSAAALVYVPTQTSMVALNATSGENVWQAPLPTEQQGDIPAFAFAPALCNRTVYATTLVFGNQTAFVTALDADSGEQRWQRALPKLDNATFSATPPVVDASCASVYVGTSVGVYRLAADTGAIDAGQPALGLCGAASMALIEQTAAPYDGILVTAGSTEFAPASSTDKCAVAAGVMAVKVSAADGSKTMVESHFKIDAKDASEVRLAVSANRNLFWCQVSKLFFCLCLEFNNFFAKKQKKKQTNKYISLAF